MHDNVTRHGYFETFIDGRHLSFDQCIAIWEYCAFPDHDVKRLLYLDSYLDIPWIAVWCLLYEYDNVRSGMNQGRNEAREFELLQRLSKVPGSLQGRKPFFATQSRHARTAILQDDVNVFMMCYEPKESFALRAAYHGRVRMLEYMHKMGFQFTSKVSATAATRGQFEALQYLYSVHCPWNVKLVGDDLELYKFLYHNIHEWAIPMLKQALECEYFGIIHYAMSQGDKNINPVLWAIQHNDMDTLKKSALRDNRLKSGMLTPQELHTAISYQNMDMIQLLLSLGCPADVRCYYEAISWLRLDIIRLIYATGCPLDARCYYVCPFVDVKKKKQLRRYKKICLFLKEHGCPYEGSNLPATFTRFH